MLNEDGVAETRFVRLGGSYTNAEDITLRPGGVLDFGNGITLANGQSLSFTYTVETEGGDR